MKAILAWLIAIFVIAGCSVSDKTEDTIDDSFSGNEAIARVILETNRTGFPSEAGKCKGIIHGGGPAPGLRIPGELESTATRDDEDTFMVTLTHYWNSEDFRNENSPEYATLNHYWKYKVTEYEVELIEHGGDFSPEFVE